jgi:DNA polymerase-1
MKKLASTYGMSWIESDLEADGRIYPNYWLNGAKTGRPTSSNPCLTNVPIREYPIYRSYFTAPKDHVILVADFSAQEVRHLAQLSRDKRLINAFHKIGKTGGNIYVEASAEVFGKQIQKGTTEYDDMKAIFLGTDYGMSDYGLAKKMGVTVKIAQQYQRKFFNTYSGVRRWMLGQKRSGEYVETFLGRRFWLNPYSHQWYRNALNSPIQGGAADQLKLSIGMLHRRWPYKPFLLATQVYDELVAIVHRDVEHEGADLMKGAMIESGELVHPLVPAAADVGSGQNWLEAKGL